VTTEGRKVNDLELTSLSTWIDVENQEDKRDPLIHFRIPVALLQEMLARKRRPARRAPASAESSPTVNFHLADYIKTPSPAVHFQLPLIRLELPLKTSSGKK
jgi:hypothetical protein